MASSNSSVTVDISSANAAVAATLTRLSDASLAGFLTTVAARRFSERAEERFDAGGDEASGKWAPLAQSTVDRRVSLGFSPGTGPGEINVRTGKLKEHLVNPGVAASPTGFGATLAWPNPTPSDDILMRLRQAAGKFSGPARWVIAYDLEDVAYLLKSLQAWTLTGVMTR